MIRAFVALELPDTARRVLTDLQGALRRELSAVRWVRPGGIHLTLKFLGDIPEGQVDPIGQTLQSAASAKGPLKLVVKGLGVFPGVRKARVIWAGLGGETADLVALQQTVDAALEPLGFARERRRFKAHLTLGRFKKAPRVPVLVSVLERCSAYPPCELTLDRVVLYRSELRPQGARYSPLMEVPLKSDGD
jgi:2'-5' RNA ligase